MLKEMVKMEERQVELTIRNWCEDEGFKLLFCNEVGIKVPCGLDKNYIPINDTIFVKDIDINSNKLVISYGGLKKVMEFRCKLRELTEKTVLGEVLPSKWNCDSCGKPNLNLKTDDGHKTYSCPDCLISRGNCKTK
jgi:hypothetical protein